MGSAAGYIAQKANELEQIKVEAKQIEPGRFGQILAQSDKWGEDDLFSAEYEAYLGWGLESLQVNAKNVPCKMGGFARAQFKASAHTIVDPLINAYSVYNDPTQKPWADRWANLVNAEGWVTIGERRGKFDDNALPFPNSYVGAPWPMAEGEAKEHGMHGSGRVRYARVGPSTIERTRDGYDDLSALRGVRADLVHVSGKTRFELSGQTLTSSREEESLSVDSPSGGLAFTSKMLLSLTVTGPAAAASEAACVLPSVSELEDRSASELHADDVGLKMYEEAAQGRSIADVRAMVARCEQEGSHPSSSELIQSVALLLAHPEHIRDVATLVADRKAGRRGRQIAMDLLASAGSPQAQAAMRGLFESQGVAIGDPHYPLLVQRFSFLDPPAVENLVLLERERAAARAKRDRTAHHAATFALGSSIGHLAKRDPAAAARFDDHLVAELTRARHSDEKLPLLAAIGNAALARDLDLVASSAADVDPEVRAQTATSLRRFEGERAWQVLLDLLGDDASRVASHAIDGIAEHRPSPPELGLIAARVVSGRTHPEIDPKMVDLLAKSPPRGAAVREALRVMQARATEGREKARIQKLLGSPTER